MPRPLRLGMLSRLLLAFAVLLVPVLLFSIWSYSQSLRDRRNAALDETLQSSQTAAALVHGLLRDLDGTTLALAQGLSALPPSIPYSQESVGASLTNVAARYPYLRALFLTDPQGVVVAAQSAEGIGTDLADRPYTRALLSGQERVLTDAAPGLQTTLPTVTLARTVRSSNGTLRGMIAAAFYAERLEELFPGGLPADARLSVYDRRGFLLYHSAFTDISTEQREQGNNPRVRTALAGQTARQSEFISEIDGQKRLGAAAPVPEFGWAVGVSRSLAVIDADIQRVYRWQAILLTALIIGAALLSIVISRALSLPLTQLAVQARAFGQGNRTLAIPHRGPTEVQSLATALAQMASEVDQRFAEREAAVKALAASEARLRLLSAVSEALAESLDQEAIAQSLTSMIVPGLADWSAVHLRAPDGVVRLTAIAHTDPAKVAFVRDLHERYPLEPDSPSGYPRVMRTGEAERTEDVTDAIVDAMARDAEHRRLLRGLGLRSRICVPLLARGRIIGTLTLTSAESGRRFSEEDLVLAEELGRRGAVALENAELYHNAQHALQARDEFLSSVSHDLRTPLTSIRGMSQLMQRRLRRLTLEDEATYTQLLMSIDHAADRMNAMVEELLDVARIDAGQPLDLRREAVDLVALARRVADEQARVAGERSIDIETGMSAVSGYWDAARLERVLANLLSNAIKYSPDTEPITVRIDQTAGRAGDPLALLSVQDRGMGIPAGDLPYIFERFHRGANVRDRVSGVGIGLSGSKRIVELHGGTISIDSEAGKGTTVTIRLPLSSADDPEN